MYGGQSTHIPLRVNTGGRDPDHLRPVIMIFPTTVAGFFAGQRDRAAGAADLQPDELALQHPVRRCIIIFFTYFYTAIVLNPIDLAENMKQVRRLHAGHPARASKTAEYIDRILTRITLPGAIFLALIAVLPDLLMASQRMPVPTSAARAC